jgi:uncharacterized protein YciI
MFSTLGLNALLFLVVYSPGPAWVEGKPTEQQPLREHGRYMLELFDAGSMNDAGPFVGADGGAAVIAADSEAAARALLEADPAVRDRVMVYTLRQWSPQDWKGHSDRRKQRLQGGQAANADSRSRPVQCGRRLP